MSSLFSKKREFFSKLSKLWQNRIAKEQFVKQHKFVSHFFFDTTGAKKKLAKRNAIRRISRSAERDKGYSPLTAQAFEKA
ncbi:MAG: hypothetical protein IJW49_03470 [Clostridia bacterium]|nr:hypothetical protein [Clostridia bacterium]